MSSILHEIPVVFCTRYHSFARDVSRLILIADESHTADSMQADTSSSCTDKSVSLSISQEESLFRQVAIVITRATLFYLDHTSSRRESWEFECWPSTTCILSKVCYWMCFSRRTANAADIMKSGSAGRRRQKVFNNHLQWPILSSDGSEWSLSFNGLWWDIGSQYMSRRGRL